MTKSTHVHESVETKGPRPGALRLLALVTAMALALFIGAGSLSASAKPRTADPSTVPVTGTLADGTGAVDGSFDVSKFVVQDGQLFAVGTFTGTVTDEADNVTSGTDEMAMPVNLAASDGSCQILDLVLGPVDLDLLGLQVHLDTVHLNITAQSGPGNLLGNLLCAVSGLLDGPTGTSAIVTQIANLLNRLLGVLG